MANPVTNRSPFLDLCALAVLQNMRFSTHHRIDGSYSGRHVSRSFGGSGEFADYRQYTPGEDLRRLDWRVMARTGRAYIKMFQNETNLVCTPVIDASRSMHFGAGSENGGSLSKLQYAQYLVTALSHIISHGRDQVGLAVFKRKLAEYFSPGSTPDHIASLQSAVAEIVAESQVDWQSSWSGLFQRAGRRGVLLLISDFLADDLKPLFAGVRLFRHRGWEVVSLHLIHPDEERLPAATAWQFEGMEGEGSVHCSPSEVRDAYEANFARHLDIVRSLSLSAGCDYRRVSTAVPWLQTLGDFLVERTV